MYCITIILYLFHYHDATVIHVWVVCSGKCVCELCSREMVRIPKIDEWKLFKVCNPCAKEIKETRVYGADSRRGGSSS